MAVGNIKTGQVQVVKNERIVVLSPGKRIWVGIQGWERRTFNKGWRGG